MANPFDQFDAPAPVATQQQSPTNPFDQFDAAQNPFDRFDAEPQVVPSPPPTAAERAQSFSPTIPGITPEPTLDEQISQTVRSSLASAPTPAAPPDADARYRQFMDSYGSGRLKQIIETPLWDYLPEEVKSGLDVSGQMQAAAAAARARGTPDTTMETMAGVAQGLGNVAKGFTSPYGMLAMGTGGLEPAAAKTVSLIWAADMARQTPAIARELGAEMGKPENERSNAKIASLITQWTAQSGLAGLAGAHGLTPSAPEIPAIQPETADTGGFLAQRPGQATGEQLPANGEQVVAQPVSNAAKPVVAPPPGEQPPPPQPAPIRMPGREMLAEMRQETAPAPSGQGGQSGTIVPEQTPETQAIEQKPPMGAGDTPGVEPTGPYPVGMPVEVEFPNGWQTGRVSGYQAGGVDEDFNRVNVQLDNGRVVDGAHPQHVRPLTESPGGETTVPGAAAETNTGQNERIGSEATAATTSAAEPMPAEDLKNPQTPPPASRAGKNPFFLRPRSDGVPDILDGIQELGGIRPPGENAGGEYDGYREAMTGPARMLINKNAAHGPDTIVAELQDIHTPGVNRIETADDLWDAIGAAVKSRQALRKTEVAQRVEGKQVSEFQRRAIQGDRPKKEAGTYAAVPAGKMLEGDSFEVQGNKFVVNHLEFDQDGNLARVEVKDGPKFGVQTMDGNEFIHVDKKSFQPGPNHDGSLPPELAPAATAAEPNAIPPNREIGGSTSGAPLELREQPTPENLDKNALQFYGKRYDKLRPQDQDEIRRATIDENIPGRQQPAAAPGRQPVNPREQPGEGGPVEQPAGAVRPAGAEADLIEGRLAQLEQDRQRLEKTLQQFPRDKHGSPQDRQGIGVLAQLRHTEGQIDLLREIANAPADLKTKWFQKFLEDDPPDAVERTLDKLIGATDPLRPLRKGELQMGFPKWATQSVINQALKVVRAAYTGGKRLAEAVQEGVKWLRSQNLPGFDQDEAHVFLLKSIQEPEEAGQKSYAGIQQRREEIGNRLTEIGATERQPGNKLTPELRSERHQLAKESRDLEKQLTTNPDYVRDVYRRMDKLTNDLQIANKAGNGLHAREIVDELKSIMEGELPRIPQDLQKRIYDELVARGEIMKGNMNELPAGRTLGDLTSWLKANGADSPGVPLRERLNLAGRLADEWNRGKDALSSGWARVRAGWDAFKAQYKSPPNDGDFRSLMKDWFYEKKWTGLETHKWVDLIRRNVPQPVRRGAISVWLDADGDRDLLQSQAGMVPDRYKPFWDAALKLSPKEQDLARRIQLDFEQKLSDGQGLGLIDRGRADYGVPQLWKVKPKFGGEYDPADPQWKKPRTPRNPTARLDPRDPFFALQRNTPSYFDGIMAGGVPKSMDIGDLVGAYNTDFHNALADRGVIKNLKDASAADGKPIVQIAGGARIEPRAAGARSYFVDSSWRPKEAVTADGRPYRSIDHWALKDWKFASTSEEGNPILVHGDFLVHPDHYQFLKNELGQSWLRDPEAGGKYFNPILNSTAFLKASKFASASFHMATLAEHSMFHAFAGKPDAERLSLLWPSTRGVEIDPGKNPELAQLMRNGLELGFGQHRELFEEGLASHGGIWGKVPGLGDAMTRMSDFLFKRYMPALKVKTATAMLHANEARYGGKLSPEQISELTSRQANAAFGGQDWKLMGTNKTMLDVNRLLFTAPDFLLSRAKVVGQALKPYGAEQRNFILAQAALVYMGTRALNQLLDKNPHWEPENAMRVIYKGRAYSARFLVSDIANMVQDPSGFASGRLGPLPRTAIEATTGRDMRTGARKDLLIKTSNPALRSAEIAVQDLVGWLAPVGAEGFLPGAAGREQTKPGQVAMAMAGIGSRKYTPENQMFDAAAKFNRNSPNAKANLYQQTRDNEAGNPSQYRKLDDLLDAGKLDAAKQEYQALQEEGHTPASMATRYAGIFRPFTGNVARERDFKQSLSPEQLQVYNQAIADRRTRLDAFRKVNINGQQAAK